MHLSTQLPVFTEPVDWPLSFDRAAKGKAHVFGGPFIWLPLSSNFQQFPLKTNLARHESFISCVVFAEDCPQAPDPTILANTAKRSTPMESPRRDHDISSEAIERLLESWQPPAIPEEDPALSGCYKLPDENGAENAEGIKEIDRRTVDDLSYEEFVVEYMAKNKPVIIQGCADDWRCVRDWVTDDGKVDCASLVSEFGKSTVNITDTSRKHGGCGPEEIMSVAEYFVWFFLRGPNDLKYLKDWHCAAESKHNKFYKLPHYFREDWLNDYLDSWSAGFADERVSSQSVENCIDSEEQQQQQQQNSASCSDYRFVYVGPKGSWTPLHSDVLRSHSWSTNVCGRKRWLILPPHLTSLIYDRHGKRMAPDFSLAGMSVSPDNFPNIQKAADHAIECIQESGESIFIPCGWHHSVENLEDTLSVNHNWINGFGVHWTWALVRQKSRDARAMIEDCRDTCSVDEFEELADRNAKADCGMDVASFHAFLVFALERVLQNLREGAGMPGFHLLSLNQIRNVLVSMQEATDIQTDYLGIQSDIDRIDQATAMDGAGSFPQNCTSTGLNLTVLPGHLAVVRLAPDWQGDPWWITSDFISVTKTPDELSIVCREDVVPSDMAMVQSGFSCLKVQGPLDFSLVGILAELTGILAEARVTVFVISTFDTDYIMVQKGDVELAAQVLMQNGHRVEF
ncbi:hypothetical protein BSKO_07405 [Bryopsis sp. KO-2023]|nr:hypothetical protein BSKO_07405 [Bryopsis sp. KO-2023]